MNENNNKKTTNIALISLIGCLPLFLGGIVIFIVIFILLGGFDSENKEITGDYAYIHSTYAYCDAINLDGELLSLEDYIAGVLEGEAYLSENDEALKAQAIASRTYALYKTNGCSTTATNGQTYQVYKKPSAKAKEIANATAGMVLVYDNDLFESNFDAFCYDDDDCPDSVKNADGTYTVTYKKRPTNETHKITLNYTSYYSNVESDAIRGHGHALGMSQYVSYQLAKEGKKYEEILKYFYSDGVQIVDLNNLQTGSENAESGVGYESTYTNQKNGKTYINYKQYLFSSKNYKGGTLSNSQKDHLANVGCATNSSAIIISGEDKSITPVTIYIDKGYNVGGYISRYYQTNRYKNYSECIMGNSDWCVGTYDASKIKNNSIKQELITNLKNGGEAVLFISANVDSCLVNGESWTSSQHYFTALDYNEIDNTVYISNPGTSKESQNGWVSLDHLGCVHVATLIYPQN